MTRTAICEVFKTVTHPPGHLAGVYKKEVEREFGGNWSTRVVTIPR